MFGINPNVPNQNLRFTIGAITTGGRPQYSNNRPRPDGGNGELLSDAFNRPDQPVIIDNWSILTTAGLGAPIEFAVFNLNAAPLRVFITLWGNAMLMDFVNEWRRAEDAGKTISLKNTGPNDAEVFWETVVRSARQEKQKSTLWQAADIWTLQKEKAQKEKEDLGNLLMVV